MKAVLDENQVITIYPETISEKIVLQYMNEEPVSEKRVVLSESIYESGMEDSE